MIQRKVTKPDSLTLHVQAIGSQGATDDQTQAGRRELNNALPAISIRYSVSNPQAILFITGGSEHRVLDAIGDRRHIILLASQRRNAYAAACEVKAYLNRIGIESYLYNLSDTEALQDLVIRLKVWQRVRTFTHKQIGLVGRPAEWLVNSNPDPNLIRGRFGFKLRIFNWEDLQKPSQFEQSKDFLDYYHGHGDKIYEDHSRLDSLLANLWFENGLDGIAVECFPLVTQHKLTACLSLARFNAMGMPAACEGDLVSLTGMLLIYHLTGHIPWMANLSNLKINRVVFSHCTIAPSQVDTFSVKSHYESNEGLAIDGRFKQSVFTIFRMDVLFEQCFIATGHRIDEENELEACRTQLSLKLVEEDVNLLHNKPLGNHHLLIPGDWESELKMACSFLNFAIIH